MSAQAIATPTAADVLTGLRSRFPEPEWILNREVVDGGPRYSPTGHQVDAVIVRAWAEAVIHAVEIKASRSDWLRELGQPVKAEAALPYIDYFWLATSGPDVAKLEEVPEHWGLLVLQRNGQLRAARTAPVLKPTVPIEGRRFWASMIRRAYQGSDEREIDQRIREATDAAYERGRKFGQDQERSHVRWTAEEVEQAKELKAAFGWTVGDVIRRAPEIKAFLESLRDHGRITRLVEELRDAANRIEGALP
jgi:hypothetical protein